MINNLLVWNSFHCKHISVLSFQLIYSKNVATGVSEIYNQIMVNVPYDIIHICNLLLLLIFISGTF